ncbi:MAG: alpha/beta fold hydrolase [Methylobacteriaceae bacterium]|nr:alpha/beta fold hydrolase [Methylobacteriaceae bacterium]
MSGPDMESMPEINRAFVRIAEGQAHFRTAAPRSGVMRRTLVMLHASPASSQSLLPLIARLAATRRVIALDTLGNGDSAAPSPARPDIAYFADAHLRALDALGVTDFDLYGSHTGGCIAAEIAIARPDRVHSLILDGMSLYSDEERAEMLARYAPAVPLDQNGSQVNWFWHFVRDTYMFWPWYRRDPEHARTVGLPSAEALHDKFVEVLKAARTYHLSYNAAIAWSKTDRLPLVRTRALLAYAEDDMLLRYMDGVAALMPQAARCVTRGVRHARLADETAAALMAFLDKS